MVDRHRLNCGLTSGNKQTQKMMRKQHEQRNVVSFPLVLQEIYELGVCEIKAKRVTFLEFLICFSFFSLGLFKSQA